MMTGPTLLLEGRPGIGKTTLVTRVIARLQQEGVEVAGFTTREIRIAGNRAGFEVERIGGPAAVLAHVDLPTVLVGLESQLTDLVRSELNLLQYEVGLMKIQP